MNQSIDSAVEEAWVVIPAYNEESVIDEVVRETRRFFKHVVVVDDHSRDGTAQVAFEAGAEVIRHPINLGQGAALQTGFDFSILRGAKYVVTIDADGQHDPGEALKMLRSLLDSDHDLVLGSRFLGRVIDMPVSRQLLLKAALLYTRITTGLILTDTHNGLRAIRKEALQKIRIKQNRMAHASEILDQIAEKRLSYHEFGNTIRYTEYSLRKGQKASNALNIISDLFIRGLAD